MNSQVSLQKEVEPEIVKPNQPPSLFRRLAYIVAAIIFVSAYIISPIDFIPGDLATVVGILDDAAVLIAGSLFSLYQGTQILLTPFRRHRKV